MTKEELEKEVEEYLENKHCKNVCSCDEIEECKKGIRIRCMSFNHKKELIIAFAEPREKRIAELEKENAELKEALAEQKQYNAFKCEDNKKTIDNLKQENATLTKKLTEAKELLEEFCPYYMYDCDATREDGTYEAFEELKEQVEQFLSEVEK